MLKTKEEIENWLNKNYIRNYTINEDLSVDVNGTVLLKEYHLKMIPIQFNIVRDDFDISYNELKSLKGCPKTVGGDFYCENNELTSLEYIPNVLRDITVSENNLKGLTHIQEHIYGSFTCRSNQFTKIIDGPKKIDKNFICSDNNLKNLDGFPEFIGKDLLIYGNDSLSIANFKSEVVGDVEMDRGLEEENQLEIYINDRSMFLRVPGKDLLTILLKFKIEKKLLENIKNDEKDINKKNKI